MVLSTFTNQTPNFLFTTLYFDFVFRMYFERVWKTEYRKNITQNIRNAQLSL